MITSNETIQRYTDYNKIYVPLEYYRSDNKYTLNGDTLTIISNNNCYQNYNTTYCDCNQYNIRYNVATETYQCNRNPNNNLIANQYITTDLDYSDRIISYFTNNYIIWYGIIIIVFLFTLTFKKNSRRI